jgi:uncharacterized protein with ParB-like and HNH nuclease domain
MKINCIDKEIKKVLETGYYHIPRFQRPYSWEKDHIEEFWVDAINESETDYFIGSIVVYKMNDELFGIVDGQQRLTTITMILCALRNFYNAEELPNLANGVHVLIEKVDLKYDKQFILQTETSYPYFQEHIQKFSEADTEAEYGPEEINLKNGFDQITKYIKTEIDIIKANKQIKPENLKSHLESKLSEIRNKILKLKVIYIEIEDEDDAYIIFETLNTRGKDLSVGDLAKNYLTKLLKTVNKGVDITKDKWNTIRENIETIAKDIDIDTFLLHEWLSKYEFTSTKKLYKSIKTNVKVNNAKKFLDELLNDSVVYKNIFDVETRTWDKNEYGLMNSLSTLNNFNVTQQTPMILSLMREYGEGRLKYKYVKEAIEAIEHFHYIFTAITSQRSSGGIGLMYSSYARKLHSANDDSSKISVIRELKQKMAEKIPTFEEFLASFRTLRYSNDYTKQKKIIHYTLSKIDKFENASGSSIDYEMMTLEHILPQNPLKKRLNHQSLFGQIGNLLLIDERTNKLLDNKIFGEKKNILKQTNINFDPILKDSTEWDSKEIEARTEYLARIAYTHVFKI